VFAPDFEHRRVEAYTPQGVPLGEMGAPNSPGLELAPKQIAVARSLQPSLYVLGSDGIERLDLENTAPPPQAGADGDLVSLAVIGLMIALVVLAVVSRRQRRQSPISFDAALDGPVRLQAKNGAQRQQQQADADQNLLVAHQTKRKK
jgi:hypothetical protein